MKGFKLLAATVLASTGLAACVMEPELPPPGPVDYAAAPAPVCPYGYYDYAPYSCAPYGFYGPEWFAGGVFIGAGPWHRGPAGFHGYVDNRYDPRYGYHGPLPQRGERPAYHIDSAHFHGNEVREGQRR